MRSLLTCLLASALAFHAAGAAALSDMFEIEKATVTLPVVYQTLDSHGLNVLATKTLKTDDLVNLALGRSLATKPDKSTEVLAFAADASTPGAGSKLIVFNPTTKTITFTDKNNVTTTINGIVLKGKAKGSGFLGSI